MARHFRLGDIQIKPKITAAHPPKALRYFCEKCQTYHWIHSNIGNEHRDYKSKGD